MKNLSVNQLEELVLCTMLVKSSILPDVIQKLKPEMFESPEMGFIYTAILSQYNRGKKPDYLTTELEMRKINPELFEKMKGLSSLSGSALHVRSGINLLEYAEELKRLYILRRLRTLFAMMTEKASLIENDCLDILNDADRSLIEIREELQVGESAKPVGVLAEEILDLHERKKKRLVDYTCVFTGLKDFDSIFGGFQNGELHVLGGRPGDGKTAVALHMAIQIARQGKFVCLYSLEMSNLQMMNRLFAGYAYVKAHHLRVSNLSDQELKQMKDLSTNWKDLPMYINYNPSNSVEDIRAEILLMKRQKRCDLVVLDYLHLLRTYQRRGETQEQVVARNVRALKQLALEANCPVLVLSQMNRASENRPGKGHEPELSDLRDSGVIEQVADGVFFVFRPERHGITKDEKTGESYQNAALLIARKNRSGTIGTAKLKHNDSFTRFVDYNEELGFENENHS